jgi:hypothetical protein
MHLILALAFTLVAQDPVPNPAHEQNKSGQEKKEPSDRVYEIQGERISPLAEEDLIGPYKQPRWAADRRFTTTRTYVIPEGKMQFEWWGRTTFPRSGPAETRYLWEFELGLPNRLQLDLYLGFEAGNTDGAFDFSRQQLEVRWAIADWGVIWGNPTLYLEYVNKKDESDAAEAKLLLGGQITSGWHWGLNFVFERSLHDQLENEMQVTGGLAYSLIDSKLSVGLEAQAIWINTKADRSVYVETVYFAGPSIQWRPMPRMHVDFTLLKGIHPDSPEARTFLIIGYEF